MEKFFSTGCTLLDLALGGGWATRRVANLVGDKSSGKTLLAIEALANFERTFKNAKMRYAETEARFDPVFAATLGFPASVTRPEEGLNTVEEFQEDLDEFANTCNEQNPGLYILDSLDSLSDDAEVKKFEDKDEGGSYGVAKAKKMSQLFRVLARKMEKNNCALIVISQLRDNIGVTFGETSTRSGGRALNFYASQILWLRELGKTSRTRKGEDRVVSVDVHGKVKKCSVGMPFREAQFTIVFGYGVDNEMSILTWMEAGSHMEKETAKQLRAELTSARNKEDYPTIFRINEQLVADATRIWTDIEKSFAPKTKKYLSNQELVAIAKPVVEEAQKSLKREVIKT